MTAPRDAGLQPERTRFAWRRTVLVGAGVTVLGVKLTLGRPLLLAVMLLAWLPLAMVTTRRIAAMSARQPARLGPGLAAIAALSIVAMAALGLLAL